MIIEFELKGSKCIHKGLLDVTGFWARFEPELDDLDHNVIQGYKIFSHFSFSFYHEDESIALMVFRGLIGALSGIDWECKEIGFIREVC